MKRSVDAAFEPVPVENAMHAIAAQPTQILRDHDPRAVAMYNGTFSHH